MPLSRERIRRYEDKISFITEDLEWLNKWLPADEEEFIADVKTRKAIYKLVQEDHGLYYGLSGHDDKG